MELRVEDEQDDRLTPARATSSIDIFAKRRHPSAKKMGGDITPVARTGTKAQGFWRDRRSQPPEPQTQPPAATASAPAPGPVTHGDAATRATSSAPLATEAAATIIDSTTPIPAIATNALPESSTSTSTSIPTGPGSDSLSEPGQVPVWWLAFVALWYLPIWITGGLVQLITLPQYVDSCVDVHSTERARELGVIAAVGSAMQFVQPFVGALSDRTRGTLGGGRRVYVVLGQVSAVAGLLVMMGARRRLPLTVGYALLMLGNSIGYSAFPAILAELVPKSQVGAASGWASFWQQSGLLLAAGLGFLNGRSLLSRAGTAWLLVGINVGAVWLGLVAFNTRPSLLLLPEATQRWGDEGVGLPPAAAAAAAAPFTLQRTRSPFSQSLEALHLPQRNGLMTFVAPFGNAAFRFAFVFIFLYQGANVLVLTFLEYFLADVVGPGLYTGGADISAAAAVASGSAAGTSCAVSGPPCPGFTLFGHVLHGGLDAEAALGLYMAINQGACCVVVVGGGALSDRLGRKAPLCAAALLLAACTVPLGYIDSYTLVLGLGAVSGLATGAGSGSLNALIADMSEPGHAARDMNWLFTAAATAQTLLNLVGGSLLTGYVRHGDTSEAYRALYIITAAIMVASLLPLWMISSRGSDRDAANSMARKPMQSSLMPRAHGAIEHGGGGGGYALDRLPHGAALCDWLIFGGSSSSQHNRKSHRYVS